MEHVSFDVPPPYWFIELIYDVGNEELELMLDWCKFKAKYTSYWKHNKYGGGQNFMFTDDNDAMMFRLKFGGNIH